MKIFLVGFMGAGKTSVAKGLAEQLSLRSQDLDDAVIEQCVYQSIAELIDARGEGVFRDMESAALKDALKQSEGIFSCGGGVIVRQANRKALTESGATVIYLTAPFDVIAERLSGDQSRPLFRDKDKAQELFAERVSLYEEVATLTISTLDKAITEVVNEIIPLICTGKHAR